MTEFHNLFELFHDEGTHDIEISPLICRANQSKSIDWLLNDRKIGHERIKVCINQKIVSKGKKNKQITLSRLHPNPHTSKTIEHFTLLL